MKISQEVLEVVSTMRCDGDKAVITEQLDRKAYLAVNKVLEALGGKWNRRAKAHVFDGDAASLLDVAIVTGEVTTHRDIGLFLTPRSLATQLVQGVVEPGMRCLEPSAGTGHIVDAMFSAGAEVVVAVERDEKMWLGLKNTATLSFCSDFMEVANAWLTSDVKFDAVVMNPPFCKVGVGDHLDHVKRAFSLLRPGGMLRSVMPSSIEFRRDKRHAGFRQWVETYGRIESLPPLSFRESGTNVSTCIVTMTQA